jgi:hypothetical protein
MLNSKLKPRLLLRPKSKLKLLRKLLRKPPLKLKPRPKSKKLLPRRKLNNKNSNWPKLKSKKLRKQNKPPNKNHLNRNSMKAWTNSVLL